MSYNLLDDIDYSSLIDNGVYESVPLHTPPHSLTGMTPTTPSHSLNPTTSTPSPPPSVNRMTALPGKSGGTTGGYTSPTRITPELRYNDDVSIDLPEFELNSTTKNNNKNDKKSDKKSDDFSQNNSNNLTEKYLTKLPLDKDIRVISGAFSVLFILWLWVNHIKYDGSNWQFFQYYIQTLSLTLTFYILEGLFIWKWFPTFSFMIKDDVLPNNYILLPSTRFKFIETIFLFFSFVVSSFSISMFLGFLVMIFGYWGRFANRGPSLVFSLLITGGFVLIWSVLTILKTKKSYQTYRSFDYFMSNYYSRTQNIAQHTMQDDIFS
jgi:hypothetical protein